MDITGALQLTQAHWEGNGLGMRSAQKGSSWQGTESSPPSVYRNGTRIRVRRRVGDGRRDRSIVSPFLYGALFCCCYCFLTTNDEKPIIQGLSTHFRFDYVEEHFYFVVLLLEEFFVKTKVTVLRGEKLMLTRREKFAKKKKNGVRPGLSEPSFTGQQPV